MIDPEIIREKVDEDETPILEFKRQWYWDNETPKEEMSGKWGEFIKDIISLSNGYLNFVGKDRYLIVGYCESESKIFEVNTHNIKILKDLRYFKKQLVQKLEKYTSPSLVTIDVELVELDSSSLLVFKIPSPCHVTELQSELKTKTRTLDQGAVLVRKGQDSDSIKLATITEIEELMDEFSRFKKEKQFTTSDSKKEDEKERSIEKTVQLYIDQNTSFSLDVGYPIKLNNWTENIVFELFRMSETFGVVREFLYLHESASQGKTLGYLKHNHLVSGFESLIVLTERPKLKDTEKRKTNIKKIFNTEHVFFIDEFGYEFLYKDCLLDYVKYNLPVYVDSLIDGDETENKPALEELKKWYLHEAAPLLVIKGYGGVGKTTLVKQFLDYIYDCSNNSGILFIDSNEIIDDLARLTNSNKKIDDIYDFYQVQIVKEDSSYRKFSKDLLKLSVDNGSLIIVLDGIDEVIAKLGSKFDVASFVESISNSYSSDLKKAKIIITCRDHFWDSLGNNIKIPEIILKPFNKGLAVEFFNQAFQNETSAVDKAMQLADKFATEQTSNGEKDSIYIPYVLDMIVYLINQKSEILSNTSLCKSNLLSEKLQNDFIIASVCEREIKKLDSLELDDQIKILMNISISKGEGLSLYDVKSVLNSVTRVSVDDQLIEKLKGHPLLVCSDNKLSFRYDFFNFYFKTVYVAHYLRMQDISYLDQITIEIIGSYIKYGNGFTEILCDRADFNDDLILFCIETIEELQNRCHAERNESNYSYQCAISSVFVFLLCAQQASDTNHSDVESRTKLMDKIFENTQEVRGLCLINIFGDNKNKLTFDFRKKVLVDCFFEQFEYFWDCPIDLETKFIDSTFKALEPRKGLTPTFYEGTFSKCCNTVGISDILNKRTVEIDGEAERVKDSLIKFFRLFYKRGNFYPKKQEQVRSKVFTAKLLPLLLKHKVVKDYIDPHKPTFKQYVITSEYFPVIKYLEQKSACIELERLVEILTKH
ncbi:hypothetical protein AU255_05055 [Methyloprofundus sedimenti]|uniref:Nephrocystin 3-like N-terminal domain-containing protein n=1 Tax=Methyloprofundus sedimenti TaxID=1420851 RepID=A0A1V8M6U7_9GAMM|nr:ATP-binding protein [Methyloprofundus sedimenti]OQK17262.1 hypothetical protein AU255_05055 [Methyloprofundus sedimenti]